MKHAHLTVLVILVATAVFAVGYKIATPGSGVVPPELIKRAQQTSPHGEKPNWLGFTESDSLFEGIRDRAYAFCFSRGSIERRCALEQDEAVQFATLALVTADAQRRMPNKATLGLKEQWVASNPQIVPQVLNECWGLYRQHGAEDARILSTCLASLTDASPLVRVPVPSR